MNILQRFHVVLGVYFTNITFTFDQHYHAHFIKSLCCYFVSIYTKILWTFYVLCFTDRNRLVCIECSISLDRAEINDLVEKLKQD